MPLQLYKIASSEVGSAGASSITFSSIPQGYKDLKLVMSLRGANNNTYNYVSIAFNGVTTNQTMRTVFGGDTSSAQSGTQSNFQFISTGSNTTSSSTFGNHELYVPNYTSSNNKSASLEVANENNSAASGATYLQLGALLWSNTAAITSVSLTGITGSFVQYSSATLYGIL